MSEPSMSLTLAMWLLGGQDVIILGLLGLIWRSGVRRFNTMEEKLAEILQKTDFASFRSMDEARERDWNKWREHAERLFDNYEERLRSHTADIARILGRMNGNHK